jgi:hypothetical protein
MEKSASKGQLSSEGLTVLPFDLFLDCAQGMVPYGIVDESWKQ